MKSVALIALATGALATIDGEADASLSLLQVNTQRGEASNALASGGFWNYENVENWGDDYPDCNGEAQSPVDLMDTGEAGSEFLTDSTFYSQVGPYANLELVNNGHSLQVPGAFGELKLPDGDYEVKHLHFHFPSEHRINGTLADGEMQIVHQRIDATGADGVAIVSVLLKTGLGNDLTYEFFTNIGLREDLPDPTHRKARSNETTINLAKSLAPQLSGAYFHYQGSLTTPPCTESVHWYVLQTQMEVPAHVVSAFKSLFPNPMNNRPVQPLNKRKVKQNSIAIDDDEFPQRREEQPDEPAQPSSPIKPKDAAEWNYEDPNEWSKDYPDCGGQWQSPIDVDFSQIGIGSLKKQTNFSAVGPKADLSMTNNGHALQLSGNFGTLKLPDGQYEVKQLDFHFPSEHEMNGVLATGEIHIVHQRVGSTGNDGLAVIAVLLQLLPGNANSFGFWGALDVAKLPSAPGAANKLNERAVINLAKTFRDQLSGPFVHYQGSLTAPPCSETVHWYILKEPFPVSKKVVSAFKSKFPMNNRPLQSMNNRPQITGELFAKKDEFKAVDEPQKDVKVGGPRGQKGQ